MTNTDSIVVSIPINADMSKLALSSKMGDWKMQIPDCRSIISFFCLNPVAYHFTYWSNQNNVRQISKVAGFKLCNLLANGICDQEFESLLKKAVLIEKSGIYITQIRKKSNGKESKVQFCLRSKLDTNRVNCNYVTYPYGYTVSTPF